MDEDTFWQIIADVAARGADDANLNERLVARLGALEAPVILAFHAELAKRVHAAYRFDLGRSRARS